MSAALNTASPLAGTDVNFPAPRSAPPDNGQPDRAAARENQPLTLAAASRIFAAQPLQVGLARRFVGGVLSGLTSADDIVLCVSELASNAVLHSSSREPGGQFAVRIWACTSGRIRAEVEDRGGPWSPTPSASEERGRGLVIVAGLATRWGITGSTAGRVAWLEVDPA
jgi:anti-sigma regulatory factor (Ser/Thr protein kinase)